jgi:hypothetical protein
MPTKGLIHCLSNDVFVGAEEQEMIQQTLEKTGERFVVTIPKEEVERYGLKEGQLLGLYVVELEGRPVMRPELRAALNKSWERNANVYHELAEAEEEASDS